MKKLFVGNLAAETTEASLGAIFAPYGTVRSLSLARDLFNGTCKGFGFVEMEGHEARAAMAELDGRTPPGGDRPLRVHFEEPRNRRRR